MIWDCEQLITSSNPVILPCSFTSQLLAIDIAAGNQKDTWYKAGYLQSFIEIEGTKFVGNRIKLIFGSQLIEIPYRTYQLEYDPADWLQNISVKIKQLSATNYQTIMGVNFSVQPRATGAMVDEVKLTGLTVSQEVMAANVDRAEGGTIYNRTNKNMYVKWGILPATATDLLVTAGSNIDVPDSYTGAAQAICANGATGSILTQTVSYV
jgi:hypothetical protein